MKEPYNWDYLIKIKTKDGTYEIEIETLEKIQELIDQHSDYEELSAKKLVKVKKGEKNEN